MRTIKQNGKYICYDDSGKVIIITTNKFCIDSAVKLYEEIIKK